MSKKIVELSHIHASYSGRTVLHDVSLTIHQHDFLAIIGPNGGGKTSLLKIILGLKEPDQGSITRTNPVNSEKPLSIGYVPQITPLDADFPITACEVVLSGSLSRSRIGHRYNKKDREKTQQLMQQLHVDQTANQRISHLSGGQRQRVFLARALMSNPQLLILDEPTANIDPAGTVSMYDLLKDLNKTVSILMVTHDTSVISSHVKSVGCLNKTLVQHTATDLTSKMLEHGYPGPHHSLHIPTEKTP